MSSAGVMDAMPALLTSTSTRPYRSITASANAVTSASLVTSPVYDETAPIGCTDGCRSYAATANPSSASTSAMRCPMPCAAPVTTATRYVCVHSRDSRACVVVRAYKCGAGPTSLHALVLAET